MTSHDYWEDEPDYWETLEPPELEAPDDDAWEQSELLDQMEREREAAAKPSMHVFVDDSGCGGFKLEAGSSSHLVMAACVFRDPKEIEHLASRIEACRQKCRHRGEFKYSKGRKSDRDDFFEHIEPVDFAIRAIVFDKSKVWSEVLRGSSSKFKSYAIRMLLSKSHGQVQNAKLVIDGQDIRGFGVSDEAYLMKKVNEEASGTLHSVRFGDSKQNAGLQLADMVAGAIRSAHMTNGDRDDTHLKLIRSRTYQPRGTLWRFQ